MFLRVTLRSCFSRTRSPRSRGRPASTSVANWRVKVQRTLDLTLPLRPGILISNVEGAALLFGAAFAGGGLGLFVGLVLGFGLIDLDDFGGEEVHFLDPGDGLVLAGDFQGAFGFLAVGIHRDVTVFWHTFFSVRCI